MLGMRVLLALAISGVVSLAACGDDGDAPPDALGGDLLDRLNALPGVTAEERSTSTPGYTYIRLAITQPVDHDDPDGPTFVQHVSLLHKDTRAPMVVQTSGYWDYYRDFPVELTRLLAANQISIEHRFFGASRPEPADWSKLTIEQMAHDQHAIIAALRTIYDGAFVTTGGSKGGMTAVYHRRFFPDDVEATVPYVAPLSFGAPDPRYEAFLDTIGPAACRQGIRDLAVELLSNRRAAMEQRTRDDATAQGHAYTRIAVGPAVESSIASLEWAFWQYYGVGLCQQLPPTTASDEDLWQFLSTVSPPSDNSDASIDAFEPYYYQAYAQLGFPDTGGDYLAPHVEYGDEDYVGALPPVVPTYDGGAAMQDIDQWVRTDGAQLLFVYGEWDPWTGGQFELGDARDSLRLTVAQGSHAAQIGGLASADREAALGRLAAWTGVTPTPAAARAREIAIAPPVVRVPPAMLRALRAR